MSHYNEIKTQLTNKESIIVALTKCGFKTDQIEIHDKAEHLYGYVGFKRNQKANIIIRRKYVGSSANDLGFVKKEDGTYEAIISDYDKAKYNDKWLNKVSTEHLSLIHI